MWCETDGDGAILQDSLGAEQKEANGQRTCLVEQTP
jgi:hypothetical protein